MSKTRKLFSNSDGTKFGEDIRAIFSALLLKIKPWEATAYKIVDFFDRVDDAIKEGTPTDQVIDKVLAAIPGAADDAIYAFIQANLGKVIEGFEGVIADVTDWIELAENLNSAPEGLASYQSMKHKTGSIILKEYAEGKLNTVESDTVIQVVKYWMSE